MATVQGYRYVQGDLVPIEYEWVKNGLEEWEKTLAVLGFATFPRVSWGDVDASGLVVYGRPLGHEGKSGDQFIVDLTLAGRSEEVFIPSFPDLLRFLTQMAPIFAMERGDRGSV